MTNVVEGLILRCEKRGEDDGLLTLLTADEGRVYVMVKRMGRLPFAERAALAPLRVCQLECYVRGDLRWLRTATPRHTFSRLLDDTDRFFLAAYLQDVAYALTDADKPAGEILPLLLNALYLLDEGRSESAVIKAAFELRAACIAGFTPDNSGCAACGESLTGGAWLDVLCGQVLCLSCFDKKKNTLSLAASDHAERHIFLPLDGSALCAWRYVTEAPAKRVFSFTLAPGESRALFAGAAEAYLLHHLEQGFKTLDNYKHLSAIPPRI